MFLIIMPVYNTAAYLDEAIQSILKQSLSFQDNIRLHLIDDASTDDSLNICRRYEKMYPDNILVTHFEKNRGVSAARNFALSECRDKEDIVAFVDSDDKLEEHALERVLEFMERHPDINIAAMEVYYFDMVNKEHKLNWRFEKREVVNIRKDFDIPQYYIGGTFLRGRALKYLHFDEDLSFWEDALAVNQVILKEEKYGLIKDAVYFYRKRQDESSLVNKAWKNEERYSTFLDQGYGQLMEYCRKEKHRLLPYIQFVIAYHLRVFLMKSKSEVVDEVLDTEEEMVEFRNRLQKILKNISIKVIISLPTSLPIIEAMLSMRKGRQVRSKRVYRDNDCFFMFRGKELARMSGRQVRLYYIMDEPGYEGMWRGRFCTPVYAMHKEDYIFAEHNGVKIQSEEYCCRKQLFILGKRLRCYFHAGFVIDIPKNWDRAVFGIHMDEGNTDVYLNEIVFDEIEQVYL